ncbi:hypothetical protein ACFL2J_04785 [Candidatus Omnitrophota bacterium]
MEKKRSVGVTVFGWFNILIGAVGSTAFIYCLATMGHMIAISPTIGDKSFSMGMWIGKFLLAITFPFTLVFISGIGTLKLKPFGRIISIISDPIILILAAAAFSFIPFDEWIMASYFATFLVTSFLKIYFFTRPKVKEQFK